MESETKDAQDEMTRLIDNLCKMNSEVIAKDKEIAAQYASFFGRASKLSTIFHDQGLRMTITKVHQHFRNRKRDRLCALCNQPNVGRLTWNANIDTNKPIAVYTCVAGRYDNIKEPLCRPKNVDYYIVTDNDVDSNSLWKKINLLELDMPEDLEPTKKARYVKTHPHVLFPNYEYSIWVDGNFLIVGDLSQFLKTLGEEIPFSSNWHPKRNDLYREAEWCSLMKLDKADLMKKQVESYRAEGMPEGFGLFETNMIVRGHNDRRCMDLMEKWWDEILKWSKRDQLSLTYTIWKLGYSMDDFGFICTEIREVPAVRVVGHSIPHDSNW